MKSYFCQPQQKPGINPAFVFSGFEAVFIVVQKRISGVQYDRGNPEHVDEYLWDRLTILFY